MSSTLPEGFERLRVLSAQLHAVTMVAAMQDFHLWHPDVRDYYMWMASDMSLEVRDTVQHMACAHGARHLTPPRARRA